MEPPNPSGLCQCGCGEATRIAWRTDSERGWIKGQPLKFILGHVRRSSPIEYVVDEATGCWIWQKGIRSDGYGQGYDETNRARLAHRLVYERLRGPIPAGMQLDHLCRNRACVNPEHLEIVTNAENSRRGARAKLTHDLAAFIRQSPKRSAELARELGVSAGTVSSVRMGTTWSER